MAELYDEERPSTESSSAVYSTNPCHYCGRHIESNGVHKNGKSICDQCLDKALKTLEVSKATHRGRGRGRGRSRGKHDIRRQIRDVPKVYAEISSSVESSPRHQRLERGKRLENNIKPEIPALNENCEVHMTHIFTHRRFFVFLKKNQSVFEKLQRVIDKCAETSPESFDDPAIGDTMLALSPHDDMWCRVRVTHKISERIFNVLYIDYGFERRIELGHLKRASAAIHLCLPFAFQCRLRDLPFDSPEIEERRKQIFLTYFHKSNCETNFVALKETDGTFEVELFVGKSEFISNDQSINFKDVLALHGTFEQRGVGHTRAPHCPLMKFPICRNKEFDVEISHYISPLHFFVHEKTSAAVFENFEDTLNYFYTKNSGYLRIGYLEKDMVVVFKSDDECFYRGRVLDINGSDVTVQFIDYGFTDNITIDNLYKITDKWTLVPEFALECKLALEKCISKEVEESSEFRGHFGSIIKNGELTVKVVAKYDAQSAASVILNANVTGDIFNVNNLFQNKYALPSAPALSLSDVVSAVNGLNEECVETATTVVSEGDEEMEDIPADLYPHDIVKVVSPDEIYVRTEKMFQCFDQFSKELQRYGRADETNLIPPTEVRKGSLALVRVGNFFRRCKVSETQPDSEEVQLFLPDVGENICTSKNCLLELPPRFAKAGAWCFCVCVTDVKPLGSCDSSWTMTAIEEFKTFLRQSSTVYLRIKGAFEERENGRVVPVDLLVKQKMDELCLFEPRMYKMMDAVDHLVEKGLAIRVSSSAYEQCAFKKDEECDVKLTTFHNQDWRPPVLPDMRTKNFIFHATVSFIDEIGQIYIQTMDHRDVIIKMEKEIKLTLSKTATESDDLDWKENDIGCGVYPGDPSKGWYRVKARSVQDDGFVAVLYVDYGDTKLLHPGQGELRKRIPEKLIHIPLQYFRTKLDNVVPVGETYSLTFLDKIHKMIVEKKVEVTLTRNERRFPLPVIMKIPSTGLNLARFFVDNGEAKKMRKRAEWYDSEAIRKQEFLNAAIQPECDITE